MNEHDWLADQFEAHRGHLQGVAYRMLGTLSDADDAVQESWIRLSRSDTNEVENLGGWLTTVVARVCLDVLRSRRSRREEPMDEQLPDQIASPAAGIDPEREALLADAVGPALLVLLETLAPAERLAFVLHDLFAVPFDEIGPILGRTPGATKQLASRARRRVQGAPPAVADVPRQNEVVRAFFAASREGNFDALLNLLDPNVEFRTDAAAVQMGAWAPIRGSQAVAERFSGAAKAARLALIDGAAGAVWGTGGHTAVVFWFTVAGGKVVAIDLLADPERLSHMEIEILR